MVGEVQPQIKEKPATAKKRMQAWVFAAVGVTGLFLLSLSVWQVATRHKRAAAVAAAQEQAQDNNAADHSGQDGRTDFDKLVNNQLPAAKNAAAAKEAGQNGDKGAAESFDQWSAEAKSQARGDSAQGSTGQNQSTGKMAEEIANFEIQERLRALRSGQKWDTDTRNNGAAPGGLGVPGLSAFPQSAAPTQITANSSSSDLQAKRMQIEQQINAAESLRAKLQGGGAVDAKGSLNPDAQAQLSQLNQSFKPAPESVAGYTKQNAYDADTTGMSLMPPGTVLQGQFTQKTISDYDGTLLKGQITFPVYDIDHVHVLVPPGATVLIRSHKASGPNDAIQAKEGFAVEGIVLPDGKFIDLSKAQLTDPEGIAAVSGSTNYHIFAQVMGVAAYALVGNESSRSGSSDFEQTTYAGDVGAGLRQQAAPLAQKYLNLTPTVTVYAGQSFNVMLDSPVYVKPWSDIYASYQ